MSCTQHNFYPRPPRGGRRDRRRGHQKHQDFYPRPPRGGRPAPSWTQRPSANFYPRPPRGGRPGQFRAVYTKKAISIHALREEGDLGDVRRLHSCADISIHALREEGDASAATGEESVEDFYPRPPRGGRPRYLRGRLRMSKISIHALREEGDPTRQRAAS